MDLDLAIARLGDIVDYLEEVLAVHHDEAEGEVPDEFDIFCQRTNEEYGYCELEDVVESARSLLDEMSQLRISKTIVPGRKQSDG